MRKVGTFILFAYLLLSLPAQAQPQAASPTQTITLGKSAVTLTGPWKFMPGDSPWQNGAPLWAQPGWNDAGWVSWDLTPSQGSVDPAYGTPGFVPGWTARGYPSLYGYTWYRLRVRITDPGQPLWLKMPNDFDDSYQVYADGRFVGQFGKFASGQVTSYSARSFSYALPPPGPDGEMVLAVRFYMTDGTLFQATDPGGMHQPPELGLATTIRLLQQADDDANRHY